MQPVAEEIGAAPYLAVPEQNAAERQIARFEEGATLEEIYAEQVARDRDDRWLTEQHSVGGGAPRGARQPIGVAGHPRADALSTVASLGFRRVSPEERATSSRSRLAIEALRALDPVLREGGVDRGDRARLRAGAREPPARVRDGGRGAKAPVEPRRPRRL